MSDLMVKERINWLTFSVLVIYPLLIVVAAVLYGVHVQFTWQEVGLIAAGYYGSNIAVGLGFHRLWSHASYKTNKFIEFILVMMTAGTLQGPVLAWASEHHKHHAYTDRDLDPHSPTKYKNKLKGFLWSHMGWMIFGESSRMHIEPTTMKKLGRNKLLVWQLKYYGQLAVLMNTVIPALIGYIIGGTMLSTLSGYVFISLGRALQQQMTFCVNSLCHIIGTQKYSESTARDIWWMFFLLLGENWHNFHHAFASDYRNGFKWYHLDIHKWLIYGLEKLGMADSLVRTSSERIEAKMLATKQVRGQEINAQIQFIEKIAENLASIASQKIESLEKSAEELALNLQLKLKQLEKSAVKLISITKELLREGNVISEKLYQNARVRLKSLEKLAQRLNITDYKVNEV